jgi:hypothetical protein
MTDRTAQVKWNNKEGSQERSARTESKNKIARKNNQYKTANTGQLCWTIRTGLSVRRGEDSLNRTGRTR